MTPASPPPNGTAPVDDGAPPAPDLTTTIDVLEERARELDSRVRRFIVERPLLALAGAVAGGFLMGRLLSRL